MASRHSGLTESVASLPSHARYSLGVLDDADLDLVAALQIAPRASAAALADVLGMSPSTVGRRLGRLEERRVLRVIGQAEWSVHADGNPRHVWVKTAPGATERVAAALAELPEAQLVAETTGRADVYCALHPADRAQARELLTTRVPAVPGVVSTHAELVLRALTKADSWRLRRLADDQVKALAEAEEPLPARPAVTGPEEGGVLRLLRANGRITAAQAARALGMSQSTAYRAIQSLLRRGVVRPRVEVEPALLGYALEVIVALTTSPGAIQPVAEELARHPSARYVSIVAGTTSVIHQGVFRHEEELGDFLTRDLAHLPGINALDVSVVLRVLRRYWIRREDGRLIG
ncbi:winged helix-turn-helix transcriptional regulator [Nonomuraea rhodomycinica]|uniref:Winged helix-turn-helix transcriptional regulator n=1 Tax=Nonomuraea rhodomycinica TaxID=1712872 RepID=A0A7Y6IMP0_9ACTN|nr:winged helix-turn-helix transcriptional regulator [Nonomuraea rhodomycinica]